MSENAEIIELLEQAQLAEDREKIDLIERAIRLADARNDIEMGMVARNEMVEAGTWEGFPEQQMIAFQWLLAQLDRDPSLKDEWEMNTLYRYKWVAAHVGDFATVPVAKMRHVLDDMKKRYEAAGVSLRPVYQQWCTNLRWLGDTAGSAEYLRKWQAAPRDQLADCLACETSEMVKCELENGRPDAAMELAKPLLAGKQRCAEQPQVTQTWLLIPFLQAGNVKEAAKAQRLSQQMMFGSRSYLAEMGYHFVYFGVTSQWTKGIKFFQQRLPWALQARNHYRRLLFDLGAAVFFSRMAKAKESVKLTLPEDFPGYRPDSTYAPLAVADALNAEADRFAKMFNDRNGNAVVSNRAAEWRTLVDLPPLEHPGAAKPETE